MDIVKVFGTNVRYYRLQAGLSQEVFLDYHKRCLRKNAVCTEPILVLLSVFVGAFHWRIFKELQMHLALNPISYFLHRRRKYEATKRRNRDFIKSLEMQ